MFPDNWEELSKKPGAFKKMMRNEETNLLLIFKDNLLMTKNKLLRMDNVGIVVESFDDAISFFSEIGLILEGRG